jgi:hypothetical protein
VFWVALRNVRRHNDRHQCTQPLDDFSRLVEPLFAAHDVLEGGVIGQCMPCYATAIRNSSASSIRSTARPLPGRNPPDRRQLRHPQASKVPAWLEPHPRFHFHFTPTSASRRNFVEGFRAKLDPPAAVARRLLGHRRSPSCHQLLYRPNHSKPQALHLDYDRRSRRHHRKGRSRPVSGGRTADPL